MIISAHIPRTYGSSFGRFVAQIYPPTGESTESFLEHPHLERADSPWYADKETFLQAWRASDKWGKVPEEVQFLNLHTPIEMWDGLYPDAVRVVWLRHPVTRIISGHFFAKQIDSPQFDVSIDEYIEIPWRQNWQTLYCGGDLSRFDFVGICAFFKEDLSLFALRMGWDPALLDDIPHENPGLLGTWQERVEMLANKDLVDRIYRYNSDDLELYREALDRRTLDIGRHSR